MSYRYTVLNGLEKVKTNTKKYVFGGLATLTVVGSSAGAAFAQGPTTGPAQGPGCFGNWRAGSVQAIDASGKNAGKDYFSQRAGDNSTFNADNRATCANL